MGINVLGSATQCVGRHKQKGNMILSCKNMTLSLSPIRNQFSTYSTCSYMFCLRALAHLGNMTTNPGSVRCSHLRGKKSTVQTCPLICRIGFVVHCLVFFSLFSSSSLFLQHNTKFDGVSPSTDYRLRQNKR